MGSWQQQAQATQGSWLRFTIFAILSPPTTAISATSHPSPPPPRVRRYRSIPTTSSTPPASDKAFSLFRCLGAIVNDL